MKIGIATLGFHDHTNESLAGEIAEAGIGVIQLFLNQSDSRYWAYNGRSDVSGLTAGRCEEIAETYRSAGLSVHSVGVYTNLIHPDETEVQANLAYFEDMMKIGEDMGVRTFITEAGHHHAADPDNAQALHYREDVWERMVATFQRLAEVAENHQSRVLIEPYFEGLLASAKRTRVFLEEVHSPLIRSLLDPANIIELNDLDEMFAQLGPWIDCLHAKDRKLHVQRGVAAGEGDLDYPKFLSLAAKHTPEAPLVMEYVGAENYQAALGHLRTAMRQAGVKEG